MEVDVINGTPICFETVGDGEPLVLVHGAFVDHHIWDFVVPALARTFMVVTYDLRGHGASMLQPAGAGTVHDDIADLTALIARLGIGPVHIAGNSSGACIALRFTTEHPECVRSTLAHEPPVTSLLYEAPGGQQIVEEFLPTQESVLQLIEAGEHRAAVEMFVDKVILGPGGWALMPEAIQDMFVRHAPAFLGQCRDQDALEVDVAALNGVSTPLIVSEGGQSPALFAPIVAELKKRVHGAQAITLSAAGHVPHTTHPNEYVAMVTQFIDGATA